MAITVHGAVCGGTRSRCFQGFLALQDVSSVIIGSVASALLICVQMLRARVNGNLLDLLGSQTATIVDSGPLDPGSFTPALASTPSPAIASSAADMGGMSSLITRQWEGWHTLSYILALAIAEWGLCTMRDYMFERAKARRLLPARGMYFGVMLSQVR